MDYFTREAVMFYGVLGTLAVGLLNFYVTHKNNKKTVFVEAITSERVKWMGELKELLSEYLSLTSFYDKKNFLIEEEPLNKYFERLIYLQSKIKLHLNYIDDRDEKINELIKKINEKIFHLYQARDIMLTPEDERLKLISDERMQEYFKKTLTEEEAQKVINAYESNNRSLLIESFNKVIDEINKDFKNKYGMNGKKELIQYTDQLVDLSRRYLKDEWERVKKEPAKGKLNKEPWYKKVKNWFLEDI